MKQYCAVLPNICYYFDTFLMTEQNIPECMMSAAGERAVSPLQRSGSTAHHTMLHALSAPRVNNDYTGATGRAALSHK